MDKINEAIIKRVTEVIGNLKNIQSIDIRIIGDTDNPLSIEYKVKESIVPPIEEQFREVTEGKNE